MSMHDQLVMTITGHAQIVVTAYQFERALNCHLPCTTRDLRRKIDAHPNNGFKPGHYNNLDTFTECLMVLTDLDSRS